MHSVRPFLFLNNLTPNAYKDPRCVKRVKTQIKRPTESSVNKLQLKTNQKRAYGRIGKYIRLEIILKQQSGGFVKFMFYIIQGFSNKVIEKAHPYVTSLFSSFQQGRLENRRSHRLYDFT